MYPTRSEGQFPDFRHRSVARAFLTSAWEIPNSRAIAEGFTPTLKAARTAFSLPVVNELLPPSFRGWGISGFAPDACVTGFVGSRPRNSASVATALRSASISASSKRLSAPAKSLGKK
jgi:hypothetical protein